MSIEINVQYYVFLNFDLQEIIFFRICVLNALLYYMGYSQREKGPSAYYNKLNKHESLLNHVLLSQSTINLDKFFVLPILYLKLNLLIAIRDTFALPRQ